MFVPCIAGLCIENQHCALGFVNVFIITRLLHVSAPTYHPQGASLSCLSFHVTHEDKDAPWGWYVGAETCRSLIIINTLTKPIAQCWFPMHKVKKISRFSYDLRNTGGYFCYTKGSFVANYHTIIYNIFVFSWCGLFLSTQLTVRRQELDSCYKHRTLS
jgi:hypothetical protein